MSDLKTIAATMNQAELDALAATKQALDTCRESLAAILVDLDFGDFQSEVRRMVTETRDSLDYPGNQRIPEMIRQRTPRQQG